MAELKEIINLMENPSKEDLSLISSAWDFAKEAHGSQKRYSGEPYFSHLSETAKNLAELGMDAKTIAAGLLHDTLEDAHVAEATLEKKFGAEILYLVAGVTKLGKLRYRGTKRHVESLQKLFVAMSKDIRVLIIKLTDRIHNMETLKHVPEQKQMRIALETLEIYAPLAHRLSIKKLHRRLEDLAFPYVYPEAYEETKKLLKEKGQFTPEDLEKKARSLRKELAKEGMIDVSAEYRVKSLYSLFRKLERKEKNMDNVHDVFAIRLLVPTVSDCYKALGIVHRKWRPLPGRIKDYIAFPKPNGYQSLHTTVFTGDGGLLEIQIRTPMMHRKIEYGVAYHFQYQEKGKKKKDTSLTWIAPLIPSLGRLNSGKKETDKKSTMPDWIEDLTNVYDEARNEEDFFEKLKKDFFQYRVFAFTPKGDVIDLPLDSSPIDFAYSIHSEIGNHAMGAKVNGKMASFDTRLKNGDIVEIITQKNAKPSRKWLEFAKTTVAKKHIRLALQKARNTEE